MSKKRDRELGVGNPIPRRDFLNGVALGIGGTLLAPQLLEALEEFAPERAADYYPPALTGMRGNHDGSYAVAHNLKDGLFWENAPETVDTGERYDLVVVGGGISGLSAAWFWRKAAGPKARILVLENHDDFGGHAKRNEFRSGNRTLLSYGGTQSIESPGKYSKVASWASTRAASTRPSIRSSTRTSGWGRASSSTRRASAPTASWAASASARWPSSSPRRRSARPYAATS
jgi:spermidine dehydrogenase